MQNGEENGVYKENKKPDHADELMQNRVNYMEIVGFEPMTS